jgi:hypothetical protein
MSSLPMIKIWSSHYFRSYSTLCVFWFWPLGGQAKNQIGPKFISRKTLTYGYMCTKNSCVSAPRIGLVPHWSLMCDHHDHKYNGHCLRPHWCHDKEWWASHIQTPALIDMLLIVTNPRLGAVWLHNVVNDDPWGAIPSWPCALPLHHSLRHTLYDKYQGLSTVPISNWGGSLWHNHNNHHLVNGEGHCWLSITKWPYLVRCQGFPWFHIWIFPWHISRVIHRHQPKARTLCYLTTTSQSEE